MARDVLTRFCTSLYYLDHEKNNNVKCGTKSKDIVAITHPLLPYEYIRLIAVLVRRKTS